MTRKIFISYSHENHAEALRCHRAIEMMCASLDDTSEIFLDSEGDSRLMAGDDWQSRIMSALDEADVFLVLMSSAYFDSVFCRAVELKRIFERHQADPDVLVIGVALHGLNPKSFHVEALGRGLSMGQFQCLPQGQIRGPTGTAKLGLKPISDWPLDTREDAWHHVAEQIEDALRRQSGPGAPAPGESRPQPLAPTPPVPSAPAPDAVSVAGESAVVAPRRWPPAWRRIGPAAALALLLLAGAGIAGGLWLQAAMRDVRHSLRVDRPDLAQDRLERLPALLNVWPGLVRLREITLLGLQGLDPKADQMKLDGRLHKLAVRAPDDPDVLYLQARAAFRDARLDDLARLADAAIERAPDHAAAQALLGLAADLRGDPSQAGQRYALASALAPESPQFAGNQARTLLDLDRPTEAVQIYQRLSNLVLAPVEQALAHWAQGQLAEAARSQSRALQMLADAQIAGQPVNQRAWQFMFLDPRQPDQITEVTLATEHRRCYVAYERRISLWLESRAGEPLGDPPECLGIEQLDTLLDVIDADLCRYLILRPNPWTERVQSLRRDQLRRHTACPPRLVPTHTTAPT